MKTVEALVAAIRTLEAEAHRFRPKARRARAEQFDRPRFRERVKAWVEARMREDNGGT